MANNETSEGSDEEEKFTEAKTNRHKGYVVQLGIQLERPLELAQTQTQTQTQSLSISVYPACFPLKTVISLEADAQN